MIAPSDARPSLEIEQLAERLARLLEPIWLGVLLIWAQWGAATRADAPTCGGAPARPSVRTGRQAIERRHPWRTRLARLRAAAIESTTTSTPTSTTTTPPTSSVTATTLNSILHTGIRSLCSCRRRRRTAQLRTARAPFALDDVEKPRRSGSDGGCRRWVGRRRCGAVRTKYQGRSGLGSGGSRGRIWTRRCRQRRFELQGGSGRMRSSRRRGRRSIRRGRP